MVDLQSCVDFCCTAKWFSFIYIYKYIYIHIHIYVYIYIYTHTHTQFHIFSIMVYHRILNMVLCAMQDLVVIHSIYNSLHLVTPTSQSIPALVPSFLPTQSVLCVCESVSISWIGAFVSYFRFHIQVIPYHMVFLFLFLTYFI